MTRPSALILLRLLILAAGLHLMCAAPAGAHPADESGAYHYLWVEAQPGQLSLQHATIVGGLSAAQIWPLLDLDGDQELSPAEQERHARELAAGLGLTLGGKPAKWELEAYEYPSRTEFFGRSFPAIKLLLKSKLPQVRKAGLVAVVQNRTFPDLRAVFPQPVIRPRDLVADDPEVSEDGRTTTVALFPAGTARPKASLPGLTVTQQGGEGDGSSGIGALERDLDSSLPPGTPGVNGPDPFAGRDLNRAPIFPDRGKVLFAKPKGGHGEETSKLKGLLGRSLTPFEVVLGLCAAALAGAAHALSPGHGKAMVGAYLVGSRGTVWDAVLLGIVVTITHTASVYVLGFLCLWLTTRIQAEVVGQWLGLVSGMLVLGMGFWLFQRGLLAYHGIRPLPGHTHGPHGHSHGHTHGADGHDHSVTADEGGLAEDPNFAAGVAGGGGGHTHTHRHGGHSHAQGHSHSHAPHAEPVRGSRAGERSGSRKPPSDSPLDDYTEGGAAAAPAGRPGLWSLIGLGVAGGMVPCFDALAILLAAVHLGSIAVGLAIIAAFSVGMAAVLVLIGVLMVTTKDVVARFSSDSGLVRILPAVSGGFLLLVGAYLTFQSLVEVGVLRIGGG